MSSGYKRVAEVEMGFEVIEHTADLGIEAWAADLEALFEQAALGLMAVMVSGSGPRFQPVGVELSAPDVEALLVDWLSELLYLFEVRGLVVKGADVTLGGDGDRTLTATVRGESVEGFEQEGPGVKAVTYHGLEVTQDASGARARVYLDV